MDLLRQSLVTELKGLEVKFENTFEGAPKWLLIVGTVSVTSGIVWFSDAIRRRSEIAQAMKKRIFQILKSLPSVQQQIKDEMGKMRESIRVSLREPNEERIEAFLELPMKGRTSEEIVLKAKEILGMGRFKWKEGRVSGAVMAGSSESYTEFMVQVLCLFPWSNPLHTEIFPGIRKMEAEIVRMTAQIFHGDEDSVGCVTLGGSESLLMVMKAYRDWGLHSKGIAHPEIVAPHTVHAAVHKAAHILGIKFNQISTDSRTAMIKLSDVEKKITKNTVMLMGSAPDFAHGIIDDIEGLSKLALKYRIPLHVDCCLGGFILPFMDAAGYPVEPFDFRVPGVTSISADTHKYGMAPKGSSVVVYRKKEYMHHQYFCVPDWPGAVYATPTMPGSRAGANAAMCWAAMLYNGWNGYVDMARQIISVARKIKSEIKKIEGLFLYGDPMGPVVSFGSDEFNIVQVSDIMAEYGWHLQPLQNPPGMHIFLTHLHCGEGVAEQFIRDLKEAITKAKENPSIDQGMAKVYGLANTLPDKSLLEDCIRMYLDLYFTPASYK